MVTAVTITPIRLNPVLEGMNGVETDSNLAQVRGINRSARWSMTQAARRTAQETDLPVGTIKRRLRLNRRATLRRMVASISFGLRPVALSSLNPRQTARGVRAKKHFVPSGFIARVKRSGQKGVWKRKGPRPYPIEFQKVKVGEIGERIADHLIKREAPPRFKKEFEKDLAFRLRKRGFRVTVHG